MASETTTVTTMIRIQEILDMLAASGYPITADSAVWVRIRQGLTDPVVKLDPAKDEIVVVIENSTTKEE